MESSDSSSLAHHPNLPPGFRFHPTDEELVVHYLKRKVASLPLPVAIIAEVDLYKFDPWELPGKATFGEQEWYFFSPRDRKYPNGARPNRAATSGYWKATGTDKPIVTSGGQKVGVKKALVFYGGKPPKGIKTNWIMHEYRLVDNNSIIRTPDSEFSSKKGSLRLDDWVLCRIYKKHTSQKPSEREGESDNLFPASCCKLPLITKTTTYSSFLENDQETFFEDLLTEAGHDLQNSPQISQLPSTSSNHSVKRSIASPSFWIHGESGGGEPSGVKRLQGDPKSAGHDHRHHYPENSNASVTLLGHVPYQSSPFNANSFLGSLGDGVLRQQYQLPGINWSS